MPHRPLPTRQEDGNFFFKRKNWTSCCTHGLTQLYKTLGRLKIKGAVLRFPNLKGEHMGNGTLCKVFSGIVAGSALLTALGAV